MRLSATRVYRPTGIPSWAPNIRSTFNVVPSRVLSQSYSVYAATGRAEAEFYFHANDTTLHARDIDFDTIAATSSICGKSTDPSSPKLDSVMKEWRGLAFGWLGGVGVDRKYGSLMRTITGDRDVRGGRLRLHPSSSDWRRFFQIEHLNVGARAEFGYLDVAVRRCMFEGPPTNDRAVDAWANLCYKQIRLRRMILTKQGRLGLVPGESKLGDYICLILGVDVPFVIRKLDIDSYSLIGEAYIKGAMDGEIVDQALFQSEIISLRRMKTLLLVHL